MMNSSLMQSIDMMNNVDRDSLSESLLGFDHQSQNHPDPVVHSESWMQDQVVFVEERPIDTNGDVSDSRMVHATGERQANHWRDAWAAVLFLAHQGIIFYLAFAWGIPSLSYHYTEVIHDNNVTDDGHPRNQTYHRFLQGEQDHTVSEQVHLGGFLWLCFLSGLGALLAGVLAVSIMVKFAEMTIQFSLIFALVCNIAVTVSFALQAQWYGFAISALFLFGMLMYIKAIWNRIAFAASNLLAALTAVQTNAGIVLVSVATTLVVSIWTLIWLLALIGVYMRNPECHDGTCHSHTNVFLFALLCLSYYWTSEVCKNVMHVTTAGTVGTWWFAPDDACTYCSPAITDSLRRATTYSLGSICFGSLLTALLQCLHQLCQELRLRGRNSETLLLVVEFLLAILESLVRYFNKWAYVYIGLYGYDYLTSGKKVCNLFQQRGWTTIVNDNLVSRALSLVSLFIAALTGCFGMALQTATGWASDLSGPLFWSFFGPFFIGLALSFVLLSVVSSAVDTVIVSFAEAPLEFERNHPGLYTQMIQAWRIAFPDEFRQ